MLPRSLFAAATALFLAAGVFYFSSFGIFEEPLVEDQSFANVSLYLRSKEIHSNGLESSVTVGNFDSVTTSSGDHENNNNNNRVRVEMRRRLAAQDDDFIEKSKKEHFPLFEVSDQFSVMGPSVFPKPTWVYEVDKDNHKIDEEIVIHLQPTSGQHRAEKDSVFVMAAEYGYDTYVLFFMTLFETGYKGDVVVGISKMDWENREVRELLECFANKDGKDEMTVVTYVIPYHCYTTEGEQVASHKGGMRVCQCHNVFGRKDAITGSVTPLLDQRHSRTSQTLRYEFYWLWSQYYRPNSWILLIDARDTVFQESPFDRVPRSTSQSVQKDGGVLLFFGENADATSLGKSKYNRRWLQKAYGDRVANFFKDKPTICSGSTMGEQAALDAYLRAEVIESDESKTVIFGADQGFHNYLYYSNKLANANSIAKILVQDQGLGIVNNMGALRDKGLTEWGNGRMVEWDGKGGVVAVRNWDGTVSPVVHQYDRHKQLHNWWHNRQIKSLKKTINTLKRDRGAEAVA